MKISVIIPVYNEQESVGRLHTELVSTLSSLDCSYEIIFIDDGSTDSTLSELKKLEPVRVISFARNFGKSQALQAGFNAAEGEYIFTMDGDLQDDPAEIPNFIAEMGKGNDLVVGWKQNRLDGKSRGLVSKIANLITGWATGAYVHDMNCGYKLYKNYVAKGLILTGDHHRYIPAIVASKGYRVSEQRIKHRRREFGKSKYGNLGRFPKSFFDFITVVLLSSFGNKPMHLFGIFGSITGFFGFLILFYMSWLIIFKDQFVGDRPLLLLGILLVVVSFQSVVTGFLGELIVRRPDGRQGYTVREDMKK